MIRRPALAIPLAWVLVLTVLFAIPFAQIPWPFGDVYSVLTKAEGFGWRTAVVDAFSRDVEYRPFFVLIVKALYSVFGLHLGVYKVLVLCQFAVILTLIVRICRPETSRRMIAVLVAVSCVAGIQTSRILFSFFPLNHHSLVMLLILLAALIALDARGSYRDWLLPLITLTALFLIEFGLLIPVILTVLFLAGAQGMSWRGLAGVWLAFIVYVFVRFTFSAPMDFAIAYTETGLGFGSASLPDLNRIFEHAPWLFWAYNVSATLLNVLFSEPRSGMYYFINSLLRDTTQTWLWLHVISSAVTTVFIVSMLARGTAAPRDRQLAWLGLSLVVFGSCLGFLYTRDRIGLPVGIGYGMLLYLAIARFLERPPTRLWLRAAGSLAVVAIAAAWLVRDAGNWYQVNDTAWERHDEWTKRFEELGGLKQQPTPLLEHMQTDALAMNTRDPRNGPLWTYAWFERRVKPNRD